MNAQYEKPVLKVQKEEPEVEQKEKSDEQSESDEKLKLRRANLKRKKSIRNMYH
jgi:hypothetical protein